MEPGGVKIKLLDGSGTVDLKHLMPDTDRHGTKRIYFRRKGQRKIALKHPPGSPEFMAEYRRAYAGAVVATAPVQKIVRRAGAPGSLRWLIERYFENDGFRQLDDRTRYVRRRILDDICSEPTSAEDPTPIGVLDFAEMPPSAVAAIRDRKAKFPNAANARLKALRQVFKCGIADKQATHNPAAQTSYIRVDTEGFHSWTPAEVRQYENRHPVGTKARLAMALLLYLGPRRSDVVLFGPQHVRDAEDMSEELRAIHPGRWLHYTQHKGRKKKPVTLTIPILPELEEVIAATPTGDLAWLVTAFGRGHTANGFGTWFRRRCNEAKLPQCSAHGLRKAGATLAAERGATAHQLMAIFGWRTLKEAERYTRAAEQMRMAGGAMHLISSGRARK